MFYQISGYDIHLLKVLMLPKSNTWREQKQILFHVIRVTKITNILLSSFMPILLYLTLVQGHRDIKMSNFQVYPCLYSISQNKMLLLLEYMSLLLLLFHCSPARTWGGKGEGTILMRSLRMWLLLLTIAQVTIFWVWTLVLVWKGCRWIKWHGKKTVVTKSKTNKKFEGRKAMIQSIGKSTLRV